MLRMPWGIVALYAWAGNRCKTKMFNYSSGQANQGDYNFTIGVLNPLRPDKSSLEIAYHCVRYLIGLGNTLKVMFHNSFLGVIPY